MVLADGHAFPSRAVGSAAGDRPAGGVRPRPGRTIPALLRRGASACVRRRGPSQRPPARAVPRGPPPPRPRERGGPGGGRVARRAADVTAGERLMVRFAEDQLTVTADGPANPAGSLGAG